MLKKVTNLTHSPSAYSPRSANVLLCLGIDRQRPKRGSLLLENDFGRSALKRVFLR